MVTPEPLTANADGTLHVTVVEQIVTRLEDEIRQGLLPAGTRLVQSDIARRLGVSGTPVREAFYVLEHLGLIVWDGRRGVRVFDPSVRDLMDAYAVRAALEALAARSAAPRLDEDDLQQLEDLLTRMESLPPRDNTFLTLNARFHSMLAQRSGVGRLARLIDAEQTATSAYVVFLGGVEVVSAGQTHLEHRAILSALRIGDPDLAAAAMSAHLNARARALERRLSRPGGSLAGAPADGAPATARPAPA